MSPPLVKTFALVAIGATLLCDGAFAAMAAEGTAARESNTRSVASAKPSRPLYIFLPDPITPSSQKPLSPYQNEQPFNTINNKETENTASERPLFLGQESRPTTSLMIGWVPPKETYTTGPYQPGAYQYTWTKSDEDCRTVDRTASGAMESYDGGGKGLHLPAGWLLGMCLRY